MRVHDADLCKRIRQLEKKVRELEARPYPYYPIPNYPYYPYYPYPTWYTPTIWNGTVTTGEWEPTTTVTYVSNAANTSARTLT